MKEIVFFDTEINEYSCGYAFKNGTGDSRKIVISKIQE